MQLSSDSQCMLSRCYRIVASAEEEEEEEEACCSSADLQNATTDDSAPLG